MKSGVFLRTMQAADKDMTIDVIGEIGWNVAYADLRAILASVPETVERIVFDIYSPGGDVWEGNGIIHEIGKLKQKTVARVQVAASMATLIAVACKERIMAKNGRWLIHNPWTDVMGDAATLEKRAKELKDCESEAASFYAERSGKTAEEMRKLMADERWLTAEEAQGMGFVSSIADPYKPEEYEEVKKEIVARGKWPKGLVEIPKEEEAKNDAVPAGAASVAAEVAPKQVEPAVQVATAPAVATPVPDAEYQRGRTEALTEYAGRLTELTDAVANRDEVIRKHQSARDVAERLLSAEKAARAQDCAKLVSDHAAAMKTLADGYAEALNTSEEDKRVMEESYKKQIADMSKTVKDAGDRLNKFLAGGLTFAPSIETWEDALAACKGDYVTAAKLYPKLRDEYNEAHKRR